jgi:hypothetical protein
LKGRDSELDLLSEKSEEEAEEEEVMSSSDWTDVEELQIRIAKIYTQSATDGDPSDVENEEKEDLGAEFESEEIRRKALGRALKKSSKVADLAHWSKETVESNYMRKVVIKI